MGLPEQSRDETVAQAAAGTGPLGPLELGVPEVSALLERTIASHRAECGSQSLRLLWDLLAQTVSGGKKTRPWLVRAVATRGGSTAPAGLLERATAAGAAVEMLHAALVIHDDIMDGDLLRRGLPTVPAALAERAREAGVADPSARATAGAIIAGDLALASAYGLLAEAGPGSEPLTRIIDHAVRQTAEGQLLDVSVTLDNKLSLEEVMATTRLKTSAYSFEAPVALGAALAELPPETAEVLQAGARDLGTAYQVVDDVLGTFGDPARSGKSASSDLLSGKVTLLTSHAAGHPDWEECRRDLERLSAPGADGAERERVENRARTVLVDSGSLAHATLVSADLHRSARDRFTSPLVPPPLAQALSALTDTLENRYR